MRYLKELYYEIKTRILVRKLNKHLLKAYKKYGGNDNNEND
jgi:hypothetical protein